MEESVVYEEVGTVLNYSMPNLAIGLVVFAVALCFLAAMLTAASRGKDKGKRWWSVKSNLVAATLVVAPLAVVGLFFGAGLGDSAAFPRPSSTSDKILANSVWAIASSQLSNTYGEVEFFPGSGIGNSDDANYRWATPKSYSLKFKINDGVSDRSCQGLLDVSEATYDLGKLPHFDGLDPKDGESISKASKVTIKSSCE